MIGIVTAIAQQHQFIIVTALAHFTEILVCLLTHTHISHTRT